MEGVEPPCSDSRAPKSVQSGAIFGEMGLPRFLGQEFFEVQLGFEAFSEAVVQSALVSSISVRDFAREIDD